MLDGEVHRRRKQMFMSLMSPAALGQLGDLVEGDWGARIPEWALAGEVVLFDAVREVLFRAVCAWSGVPLDAGGAGTPTRQFAAMVEGGVGRAAEPARTGAAAPR